MKSMIGKTACVLAMLGAIAPPQTGHAAELHAIVSGALSGAFRELVPRFEQASRHKLVIAWGPSSGASRDAIPARLDSGEMPDVLIMVESSFDKLVSQGKFLVGQRTSFARSRIGVGVKSGFAKPDVTTVDGLRQTFLNARSIGYSEGASGVYVSTELLARLGIADQVMPKARKITGELVGKAIARGEVDIGLQQVSELKVVPGVDYVGPLPEAVQKVSIMVAAVAGNAKEPEAANAFIMFLASADAAPILAKSGLDPVE
jgi:molybdate transport system substrate-binding protein